EHRDQGGGGQAQDLLGKRGYALRDQLQQHERQNDADRRKEQREQVFDGHQLPRRDGQRPGVSVPVAVFVHAGGGGGVHAHHKDHGVGQEGHFQQGGQ